MNIYITYGVANNDLEAIKKSLEKVLNIEFELHESSYWGEYYIWRSPDFEEIRISYNFVDEDWLERNFREYPVLIHLSELKKLDEIMHTIKKELSHFKLIRKTEIIPGVKSKEYLFINDKPLLISEQELKKLF